MGSQGPWTIYIPKKRKGTELTALEAKRQRLEHEEKTAKKAIKARGAFNDDFFSGASRAESITLERLRVSSDISFSHFDGDLAEWSNQAAARDLFSKIRAADDRARRFQERGDALTEAKKKPHGNLRAMFMKLFTNARSGLHIHTGEGPRDSSKQSDFRNQLLKDMNSVNDQGYVWCPIRHRFFDADDMTASHIFSYKHGQETMDAIFGKIRPSEMFSSRNGIIIHKSIEKHFDSGVFVIVPDVPDRLSLETVRAWLTGEVKDFKIRIINGLFHKLDRGINGPEDETWRDLDGRRLSFRSKARPAARYLYFHYCLQILRRVWQAAPEEKRALALYDEFGQHVWATTGRYIGRNMLRALVETLGHEYKDLLRGASYKEGNGDQFMNVVTKAISESPSPDRIWDDEETETEDDEEEVELLDDGII